MAMGRGGAEGWGLRPRPTWIFLAPSPPLKAPQSPAPPRKTLFLVNIPYNYNIFSNKMTYFNNKNILEPNKCYKLLSSVYYFFF